jgi:hypothetical protein
MQYFISPCQLAAPILTVMPEGSFADTVGIDRRLKITQ